MAVPRYTISLKLLMITATLTFFYPVLTVKAQDKTENSLPEIDSYLRYIPSRAVSAQSGKIEIIEANTEYSYEFKIFGKLPVKFSPSTQYIGIEDTVEVELPAHLIGLAMDIETTLPFFNLNQTYLRLGISPSFYGDDWGFTTSEFRFPSRYFLIHQPNTKLTLIGGIAVYPDFENEVWPILGFIYQPNAKLTFNIVPKRPNITYALGEKVNLFAEGGLANSEFEVDRDNSKNVVLRYKETRLGCGIKYKFNKFICGSVSTGGTFNRSLKYRDDQGKMNIKNGLYTEFRIEVEL